MKKIINITILPIYVFLLISCSTQEEGFYLENAEFYKQKEHIANKGKSLESLDVISDENFLVFGHRIVDGKGLILAERKKIRTGDIDGDSVHKLTVFIKDEISNYPYSAKNSDKNIIGFYSAYGVVPDINKAGCFGYISQGDIVIDKDKGESLIVNFDVIIDSRYIDNPKKECGKIKINKTTTYKKRNLSNITPWEGRVSTDLDAEKFN